MSDINKIQFVHEDSAQVIAEMKADLETRLNRQISPSDVEMLLIQAFAYRETLIRSGLNETARQNLVSFSRGAALEYLGELVGVSRLTAAKSLCNIEFQLVAGHTGVIIPEGMRVQSMDGKVVFRTIESKVVSAGTLTASITAECTTPGAVGNGYAANTINIVLDPQAYVSTAKNTNVPKGGANDETDEELRERIKLAPASFSVAGPTDAYKFFAKSAHPSIVDVAVTSPIPGQVNIYPLLENGGMPNEEILLAVQAICNADKVRPLTDTVVTLAPVIEDYAIEVNLTLLTTAVEQKTLTDVQTNLNAYKEARKGRLGLDVVRNKIASLCMLEGVYNCDVITPAENIVASPEKYTNCTGIIVTVTGTHDE